MPYFERPGFSMHYELIDGLVPEDTVFLHGNLAANVWWEPAIECWKKKPSGGKGRLILAEWRGCGGSKEFAGGFDLPTLGADYNGLLGHLGVKEAHLLGHSTGGLIGLHAMSQKPSLYQKAVLLDPVAPDGIQFGPEMIGAFQQMSQDRNFCAAVILGTIHRGNLTEAYKEKIVDAAFGVSPLIWEGVPELLKSPPALDLGRIPHPILVAHGEADGVLSLEKSEALARDLPNGSFRRLEGRGHSANVEAPLFFVEMVDSFLFS